MGVCRIVGLLDTRAIGMHPFRNPPMSRVDSSELYNLAHHPLVDRAFANHPEIGLKVPHEWVNSRLIRDSSGNPFALDVSRGDTAASVLTRGWWRDTSGSGTKYWSDGAGYILHGVDTITGTTSVLRFTGDVGAGTTKMMIVYQINNAGSAKNQYGRWTSFSMRNSLCSWDCHPIPAYMALGTIGGTRNYHSFYSRSGSNMYIRSVGDHEVNPNENDAYSFMIFEPSKCSIIHGHNTAMSLETSPGEYTFLNDRVFYFRAYEGSDFWIYKIYGLEM